MNFASVIARFATGTYTVTRKNATTVDGNGNAVLATTSTFSVTGAAQPHRPRRQYVEEQGTRIGDRLTFYCTTLLRGAQQPDLVSIRGRQYEVEDIFDESLGGYYKYTLISQAVT